MEQLFGLHIDFFFLIFVLKVKLSTISQSKQSWWSCVLGLCICLVFSVASIQSSSRHITLPVTLPSNLTVSKWALSHGIIAAWFITSTNYWCQINQAPYKMKWQNKLYLEEFSESYVLFQLLAKTATNKSWLKILVACHWLNGDSGVWDKEIMCKDTIYYSKFSSLGA